MLLLLWLITVKITVISRMTDNASVKVRSELHRRVTFKSLSKDNGANGKEGMLLNFVGHRSLYNTDRFIDSRFY